MKKTVLSTILLLCLVCIFTACGDKPPVNAPADTGFMPAIPGNFDSKDHAIVISKDTEAMTITFQTTFIGKRYTLNYDGATEFYDKYGQGISLQQVGCGDIVDTTFMRSRKRLNSMTLANDSFTYSGVEDYELDPLGTGIIINGERYNYDKNLAVITGHGPGSLMDINPVDTLTVRGCKNTVYSIYVERGHGYVRLVNDSYFIGGWIDIGQDVICVIEEDMVIAAPAGENVVNVSNQGSLGTETITITEGEEYELDVSKWQGETKYGKLLFVLSPENANVYIDGNKVDTAGAVELEYGIHQMIVIADGYQTISRYVKVGSESASIDVIMEPKEGSSVSNNSVSGNGAGGVVSTNSATSASGNEVIGTDIIGDGENGIIGEGFSATNDNVISTTGEYKVYIEAPSGAEVYVDGSYVGIAPVSFAKSAGSRVVTLRKSGYQTRSYTVSLDDSKKDVNYSFSELVKIE